MITKNTMRDLLILLQEAASVIEGDYGKEDAMAESLRDMHGRLIGTPGAGLKSKRHTKSPHTVGLLRKHASTRKRDKNGYFIKAS